MVQRLIFGKINGFPMQLIIDFYARNQLRLISEDGLSWELDALHENLLLPDVQAVSHIPLGRMDDNFWAWAHDKNGLYSVRSAYHLLMDRSFQEERAKLGGASTSNSEGNPMCKVVWKMSVPPKVCFLVEGH